jgi:hypothetical protein
MQAAVQQLVARPLRYAAKFVLQRPWLKKRMRDMVIRMPGIHAMVMRVMFQAPARPRITAEQKHLSSNGRRVYRALKQAIRTHQR